MKKLLSLIFAFWLTIGNVMAATIIDTPANYWAAKEIAYCIKEGIINLYADNSYRPEVSVKRSEFNSMLLRALGHEPTEIIAKNKFKDLNQNYWAYSDILKSDEIGLIYGYPDGTFKPDKLITKTEVASIISHITKDSVKSISKLNIYTDADKIPAWGRKQYAKSLELGIYVNHPDPAELLPNKVLNRAEAAVLFYRLRLAMGAVKKEYVGPSVKEVPKANVEPQNTEYKKVTLTNFKRMIFPADIVVANIPKDASLKTTNNALPLNFTVINDVYTEKGSLLIPRGAILTSVVKPLNNQKVLDSDTKVTVNFTSLMIQDGSTIKINGKIVENKESLTFGRIATLGRLAGYTVGSAAQGGGAGIGLVAVSNTKSTEQVTGLVTPGFAYKLDSSESLTIELTQGIYNADSL